MNLLSNIHRNFLKLHLKVKINTATAIKSKMSLLLFEWEY